MLIVYFARILAFAVVLSGFSEIATAQEKSEDSKEEATEQKAPPKKSRREKRRERDESHENDGNHGRIYSSDLRKENRFTILAEMGLLQYIHFGRGIQAGYFLTPDSVAELDVVTSEFQLLGQNSEINVGTLRYKSFVGNSLFLQGGLGIRETRRDDVSGIYSGKNNESHFSAKQIVAEFGLGNRWQFGHFTMGCDWVGLLQPIAKISSSESFDSEVSETAKDSRRSDFENMTSRGTVLLVRFHLGAAF